MTKIVRKPHKSLKVAAAKKIKGRKTSPKRVK